MIRLALALLLSLVGLVALALAAGARSWSGRTRALRARLAAAQEPPVAATYDARELAGLPAPVQRFFRTTLTDGQPLVARVELAHAGTFDARAGAPAWRPFTSTQAATMRRPGFVWDGTIAMLPGVPVRVHDAYVAGEGILHATLGGLVTVAHVRGTPAVAEGELLRWLAESAWYPTALLPSQGALWEPLDDRSARVTVRDGTTAATLTFHFDEEGRVATVRAAARGRTIGGAVVPTPWVGRWWDWERRDGILVPRAGEVGWELPGGVRPYWRGRVTRLQYAFRGAPLIGGGRDPGA